MRISRNWKSVAAFVEFYLRIILNWLIHRLWITFFDIVDMWITFCRKKVLDKMKILWYNSAERWRPAKLTEMSTQKFRQQNSTFFDIFKISLNENDYQLRMVFSWERLSIAVENDYQLTSICSWEWFSIAVENDFHLRKLLIRHNLQMRMIISYSVGQNTSHKLSENSKDLNFNIFVDFLK